METLLDDFLEIDAIIGGIIFYRFADHIFTSSEREIAFLGPRLKKMRTWWTQVHKQGLHTCRRLE
jgi:hypothetical protein